MIGTVLVLALMGWSYWLMYRGVRSPGATTPLVAQARHTTRGTGVLGLEDDPDQWRAAGSDWTALDERQLTRLLADSAPIIGPTTNSVGTAAPHVEQRTARDHYPHPDDDAHPNP